MIRITTSSKFKQEKEYIFFVIFKEFLGVEYEINYRGQISDYIIEIGNGNKIIIKDCFFNNFPDGIEYISINNIPDNLIFYINNILPEKDLPVLYGEDYIKEFENKIECGIDIFASSFFMLTRWEEYANKARDEHNRFTAAASIAFKFNFLSRPIVNEYLELLKVLLKKMGFDSKFQERKFTKLITHDVDAPLKYNNLSSIILTVGADLIRRKNLKLAVKNISGFIKSKFKSIEDPYNTFYYLMSLSDSYNIKSYFFFMSRGLSFKYENRYKLENKFVKNLIKCILKNSHYIGLHSSYHTYNNFEQLTKEKKELENASGIEIKFGRQHYLRFEVPVTWQIWEDAGLEWDSTLGYTDHVGFRCGTCYKFPVFNFLTRKKLNLIENPLIMMEKSIFSQNYMNIKDEYEVKKVADDLVNKCKKYNGCFTLLWHNSGFNNETDKRIYEYILSL